LVMYATDSTIANNQASCVDGGTALAGGAWVGATAKFTSTTISGNSSTGDAGGLHTASMHPVDLINSTVSGNSANGFVGGLDLYFAADGVISYSTVTRNVAGQGSAGVGQYRSPGAHLVTTQGMKILNSILADNTYGPSNMESDLSAPDALSFQVDHNLIGVSTASIASDNITNVCPLLGPLRDNGGLTKTHALLSHSPAIDAGVYTFGSQPTFDQRGSPYARVITASFVQKIDIGAYEVQPTDIIFNAGLDACVSLP
jgi:hypothetical protein